MAGANTGVLELSYQASGAIRIFRCVKLSGDQTVAEVAASTDRTLGVIQGPVASDEVAKGKGYGVTVLGVSFVTAGAAITRGATVMPDSQGRAVTAATAGNIPFGIALKAAANAGDYIPVLLIPGMAAIPA